VSDLNEFEKLLSEVPSNEAVDEEVDAAVEDPREVGHVGQADYPPFRNILVPLFIASYYTFNMRELPDVEEGPWGVAAHEGDDYAEENQAEVHLLVHLPLGPKPLYLSRADIQSYPHVEEDHDEEGNHCHEEQAEVDDVVLDVHAVHAELGRPDRWSILCWKVVN